MHWIIQESLYEEEGAEKLLRTLVRFSIPHSMVAVGADGKLYPEPDIMPGQAVMICGTYALARVSQERGWKPGTFMNRNHEHTAWVEHWGELMLNASAVTCSMRNVEPDFSPVFIRPAEDNKFFSGMVLNRNKFLAWKAALASGTESPVTCSSRMNSDIQVTFGPVVTVYRECRFFIVGGRSVASSVYKVAGRIAPSADVEPAFTDFARHCISVWQPADAFVLDVALTPAGYRIVEVNCINMSGFYEADVQSVVMEIEALCETV